MERARLSDELEVFTQSFWDIYPRDLAQQRIGVKEALRRAVEKLHPDEELQKKILADTGALIKYDRELRRQAKTKFDEPARWPAASVYINQFRWEREIGSLTKVRMQETSPVQTCSCGATATHSTKDGKSWCARCLTNTFTNVKKVLYNALPDHMKKLKTETKEQWVERHKRHTATIVKEFARKIGG